MWSQDTESAYKGVVCGSHGNHYVFICSVYLLACWPSLDGAGQVSWPSSCPLGLYHQVISHQMGKHSRVFLIMCGYCEVYSQGNEWLKKEKSMTGSFLNELVMHRSIFMICHVYSQPDWLLKVNLTTSWKRQYVCEYCLNTGSIFFLHFSLWRECTTSEYLVIMTMTVVPLWPHYAFSLSRSSKVRQHRGSICLPHFTVWPIFCSQFQIQTCIPVHSILYIPQRFHTLQ